VVVPRNLDQGLKARMKQAFLNAHLDPKGKQILRKMKIDRFVEIDDRAYDSVRKMQDWLELKNAEK
jgi:phosphonate transport system substrate-binding protein